MALTQIDDRGLKTPIDLLDNEKIRLGTGNDLEIYHDTENYIKSATASVNLILESAHDVYIKHGAENMLKCTGDGAVELYHDNSKRLETTSVGVKLLGSGTDAIEMTGDVWFNNNEHAGKDIYFNSGDKHLIFEDEVKAKFGSAGDLEIYHDASHSYIYDTGTGKLRLVTNSFRLLETDNSTNMIAADENGAVELYHNGTKRVETTAYGTKFPNGRIELPDESGHQFQIGAIGDFTMEHDGSNTYLKNITGNTVLQNDAAVEITASSGGTKRFRFDSDGLKFGSDTAAANALSDYEEGSWTPSYNTGSAAGACFAAGESYNTGGQTGRYTKIGNIVHFRFNIDMASGYTAKSGVLQINGLPFTSKNETYVNGGAAFYMYTSAFGTGDANKPHAVVIANATYIQFYNSNGSAFAGTDLSGPQYPIQMFGSYQVA